MANEHIGRRQSMGLGKESTPGTPVAASAWIPKMAGSFRPLFTKAKDTSSYGNISELRDSKTVKQMTEAELEGIFRDKYGGHLLMAAFGTTFACYKFTLGTVSGTFVKGETITQATSGATGVIRRVQGSGATQVLYITVTSGTFTSGSNTITGGTSSATAIPTFDSALRSHVFELLNSNNHPSYTIWSKDDVATLKSAYMMLESLELEVAAGDFLKFKSTWRGKKEASDSATPAFTAENEFLAKHASVKFADDVASLDAASATDVSRLRLQIAKNLKEFQAFGTTDITSQHNQHFAVSGDLEALFTSETLKNYVVNSTKKAMRLELTNTDVTIGTAGNPTLRIDFAQLSFGDWDRDGGENDLRMQTLGFEGEFKVADSETIAAILTNAQTTAY